MRAVCFDLGNTLVVVPPPYQVDLLRSIIAPRAKRRVFAEQYRKMFIAKPIRGARDLKKKIAGLCRAFNTNPTASLLNKAAEKWRLSCLRRRPFRETRGVLSELKRRGYKLCLLTNITSFAYEIARKQLGFDSFFDAQVLSFRERMLKPDQRLFKLVVKRLRVPPQDIVVVGNSLEEDFRAARRAGMHAILLDRLNRYPNVRHRIRTLKELPLALEKLRQLT